MKKYWHNQKLKYDGTQLSSLFAYRNFSVQGDSILGFRGECEVLLEEMVDLADVKEKAFIYSTDMIHFIVEFFVLDLEKAVLYQRTLTAIVKETLETLLASNEVNESASGKLIPIVRKGDDLYIDKKKLSVSIATLSPVSSMIHFGINVSSDKTPVPTLGLQDLGIEANSFAIEVLDRFATEVESIYMAKCKVRGVN